MRLPQNILTKTYTKPRIFLCEADKTKICQLETTATSGAFKFNSYSELSFEVSRLYNDLITGETKVNPYYDKIEALRLIYLEGIGYFEIQTPELVSDGIKEAKNITAYSSEYTLTQKYLEDFYVNTGEIDSREVLYAESIYGAANSSNIEPIRFYQDDRNKKELSLLDLVFDKIYGWEIGHIDESLKTLSRTFEIDRQSVYDFLMNEVCEKFNCFIVFDTMNNKINFYAESLTQKFMGGNGVNTFVLVPAFDKIGSVSVDGFKTTQYNYYPTKTTVTIGGQPTTLKAGTLILAETPKDQQIVEVVDGSLSAWETDVFVTFDNLSQEIKITYDADDIKTQLTVTGAEELDIREVNMGQPYLVDLSYYCTPEWLGVDLYNAYTAYLIDYNSQQGEYSGRAERINDISADILWHENRMSTAEDCVAAVQLEKNDQLPPGKYFIREGSSPNYYYKEVSLPADYNVNHVYYKFTNQGLYLSEDKVHRLYEAFQAFFQSYFEQASLENKKADTSVKLEGDNKDSLNDLVSEFSFDDVANEYSSMLNALRAITNFISPENMAKKDPVTGNLIYNVEATRGTTFPFESVNVFLDKMWEQLGYFPLKYLYQSTYTKLQSTAIEANWGDSSSEHYGKYFAVFMMVKSIDRAVKSRNAEIERLRANKQALEKDNAELSAKLNLYTYFIEKHGAQKAKQFMMRMSAFLREDEYTDDNFVYTGQESMEELYQLKQELKECGRIELSKLCQPKLQFSMSMANIYALPEFEPIIDQFQLGNVIKVALRKDYIKQSRLLQVNINFDDFSDFSCEFGDLTSLQTQSDLHADLLAQAISAGKSVASNKSYWDKGSDTANNIDLRIQRGLLDAVTSIKSMEADQSVELDAYGIHLRKENEDGSVDPEEGWITNNKFLYSSDNFQTVQSVFGKYTIDGEDYWGVLAKAVSAGLIEGSQIRGGTIKIGELPDGTWTFEVDRHGNVIMCGGDVVFATNKNTLQESVDKLTGDINEVRKISQKQIDDINSSKMYRVEISTPDSQIFKDAEQTATLECEIYSWDEKITTRKLTDDGYPNNAIYMNKTYSSYARWLRKSNDPDGDQAWNFDDNGKYKHTGGTLEITPEDVVHNASFYCEVEIPDLKDASTDKPTDEPEKEPDTNQTT